MKNTFFALHILFTSILLFFAPLVHATTYHVKTSGSDAAAGTSWATAFRTLGKALDVAVSGDEIWVAAGTYFPDEGPGRTDNDRSHSFVMKNGVELYGGFASSGNPVFNSRNWTSNVTILSGEIGTSDEGDNSFHVINNSSNGLDNTALLDGFNVTKGNAFDAGNPNMNRDGGGMYNFGSSPTVKNCIFLNNKGRVGAGMSNVVSSPVLLNCSFLNNIASSLGGGIINASSSNASITNCTFSGNSAQEGGGAIDTESSSNLLITNCVFSDNTAPGGGGAGVRVLQARPTITNCTFTRNIAISGGALYIFDATPIVQNSILWDNSSEISIVVGGVNVSYSIVEGNYAGTGNLDVNPLFVSTSNLRLQACSRAMDAGLDALITQPVDLDGNNRKFEAIPGGQLVDMGAYERQVATTPPSITCPATQNLNLGTCTAPLPNYISLASANHLCGAPVVVQSPVAGTSVSGAGPLTITLTATNIFGSTNACSFTVNKLDVNAPNITCPADQTVAANGSCSATIGDKTGLATNLSDNCGGNVNVSQSPAASTTLSGHNSFRTITLTATDGQNNMASCTFNITLKDITRPTIGCPADQTVAANSNCANVVGNYRGLLSLADNCTAAADLIVSQSPVENTPLSGHGAFETITMTANDNNGNTSLSCSFKITLKDVTAPTITCPADQTIAANANCSGAVGDYVALATNLSDHCTAATDIAVSQSPAANTALNGHNSAETVTLTADDGHENTATCTFTVTLKDVTPPTLTCPADQTVAASIHCSGVVGEYVALATNLSDHCTAAANIAVSQSPAENTPLNGHDDFKTVTITADDGHGNTVTCTFTVTLKDVTPPTINCPADQTVAANNSCSGAVGDWIALATNLSDFCTAAANIAVTQSPAANTVLNSHNDFEILTLTAADGHGNSATCTLTVTLKDQTAPTLTCPANFAKNADPNQCSATIVYSVTAMDACSTASPLLISGLPSGATFPAGTTQVVWKSTDGAGNTATCSFMVSVQDVQNPSIICPANQIKSTDIGQCSAVAIYTTPSFSDNCSSGLSMVRTSGLPSGSLFPKGTSLINWQVTDGAGLTAICNFSITVNDNQAPSITCPANVVRGTDSGRCDAVVTYSSPAYSDNCPGVLAVLSSGGASGTVFQKGANTVVWKATDAAGSTATCAFTVTVNDNQQPSITCPANQTKSTDLNACTAIATYTTPTFTDNCSGGGVLIQSGLNSGAAFPKGINTVIWRATDASGLTKTCTFRVTVNDTQAPAIACPANITAQTDAGQCTAVKTYSNASFTDNCTGGSVVKQSGLASGSAFPTGSNSVVFKALDAAGNQSLCTMTVTVTDAQVPTVACPANIVVTGSTATGICSQTVTYNNPTASDNCGILSNYLLSGLASGSVFPEGTVMNVWKATDLSGLTATCAFTVTVHCGTSQETTNESRGPEDLTLYIQARSGANLDLRLAPNPATAEVQISVEGLSENGGVLMVLDAAGRVVWQQQLIFADPSNPQRLNVSAFAAGIYLVALRSEGTTTTKRLIISKL